MDGTASLCLQNDSHVHKMVLDKWTGFEATVQIRRFVVFLFGCAYTMCFHLPPFSRQDQLLWGLVFSYSV